MKINIRNITALFLSVYFIITLRLLSVKKRVKKEGKIISVYFHNPSKRLFSFIVKWFIRNHFKIISPDELNEYIKKDSVLTDSCVIFTVDDGWKENKKNIVDVATKYKIPVTIFITVSPVINGGGFWWSYIHKANKSDYIHYTVDDLKKIENNNRLKIVDEIKKVVKIEREALTINDLIEISKNQYVTIGSHTLNHPILTKCSNEISFNEINESKRWIEAIINKPVYFFAYPNGNYSNREIENLIESGYKLAFTTQPEYLNMESRNSPYTIPRFDVLENVSYLENLCRATGIWFNRKYKY